MKTAVKDHRTWGNWKIGDALWWRDEQGIHGLVATKETVLSQKGPRGGQKMKERGIITEFNGRSLAEINRLLGERGFLPLRLRVKDIAWRGN